MTRFETLVAGAHHAIAFGQSAGELRAEVYLEGRARARFARLRSFAEQLERTAMGADSPSPTPALKEPVRIAFAKRFAAADAEAASAWAVRHLRMLRDVLDPELR